MASRLKDNISSSYFEAANALASKRARRRIVAYVESYDDIYFWRTVLSPLENDQRYFEVMLPSKLNLTRGKKSVLMNFLEKGAAISGGYTGADGKGTDGKGADGKGADGDGLRVGRDMIACVDADYDYLISGATAQSRRVLQSPYVFHTYVYAIENYQCYVPSLHDVCVSVTLNDHRIFDFLSYFSRFSETLFPLFVWSIMLYRDGRYSHFTISDFNRVSDPGGFSVQQPEASLKNVRRKVAAKLTALQREFPDAKAEYLSVKEDLKALGVTPQTTYLYIQGHHFFDTVVAPIVSKVCNLLRQERQNEIFHATAHKTQKRNEMTCYENSLQDVKTMLKKNTGYMHSEPFRRLQKDLRRYLDGDGVAG